MSWGRHLFETSVTRLCTGSWRWCVSYGTAGDCVDVGCGVEATRAEAVKAARALKRRLDAAYKAEGWPGVQMIFASDRWNR